MTLFDANALALGVPLAYAVAAVLSTRSAPSAETHWRIGQAAALVAVGLTALAVLFRLITGSVSIAPGADGLATMVRVDFLGLTMLVLVTTLGWVIVRYSRTYLDGERRQARYLASLSLTLGAISVVVINNHLGVMFVAWVMTSLSLHRLLTFYDDRPAALIAAHKKFLASRLAELCFLVALVLIYQELGTLTIDRIAERVQTFAVTPGWLHLAALLIALGVMLKSAQLPLHGWLIQVMEAPTPVSALLHAGIVNLGGFVLIRLAALLSAAPIAQTMLVLVGSLTAALAALVMTTRISIKVRLAWSTCAQMGFMLMECGLGLYELALLHLLGHSLYKAHAFLSAGGAVHETRMRQMMPIGAATSLVWHLFAAIVTVTVVAVVAGMWGRLTTAAHLPQAFVVVAGLAMAPLLWRSGLTGSHGFARGLLLTFLLANLYTGWHVLLAGWLPPLVQATPAPLLAWVGLCFALLYLLQAQLLRNPQGTLARRIYPWAYAGFYLDDIFTRLTFRFWPARLPKPVQPDINPIAKLAPTGEHS